MIILQHVFAYHCHDLWTSLKTYALEYKISIQRIGRIYGAYIST